MTLQWNHRTAVVNGLSMHYVTHGQGSPVILLHGWPEFWYSWRHQIPVLAERFEVIAPDLRGFGYSDSRSRATTRAVLPRYLRTRTPLRAPRLAIVAHDIGARVAYRLTLDHEDTVERLVLLDATPPIQLLGSQVPQVSGALACLLSPAVRFAREAAGRERGDLPTAHLPGVVAQ